MSDEERAQDSATSDPSSSSSQANSVESIQDSHNKERKVGGGALVVVGFFNLIFGLAGGGFLGISGLIALMHSFFGLMLLAMALIAGLQVVASVGMFMGREKSVEFADLLAKLFLVPISLVIMVLVYWSLLNNGRLQEDDILAVAGFAIMAVWPVVLIAFAMRRHRLIHGAKPKVTRKQNLLKEESREPNVRKESRSEVKTVQSRKKKKRKNLPQRRKRKRK
ncbi:MAG: hypothetical protein ABGZ53_13535 [Fuerstiella sp.]